MGLAYSVLGMKNPGYKPEDWSAVDPLAWLKAMAWDLRGDYNNELSRAQLAASVHPNQLAVLFPPYPYDTHLPILSSKDWVPTAGSQKPTLSVVPPALQDSSLAQVWRAAATAPRRRPADHRGAVTGSGRTRGSSARPARAPATPCSPTTPTSASGSRASGCSSGCTAAPSRRPARSTSRASVSPASRGRHRPQRRDRLGLHQPRARCHRLLSREDHRGDIRAGLPAAARGHPAGDPQGRRRADVALTVRETVHGPVISDVVDSVAAMGKHPVVAGKAERAEYAVSLAWTGLVPSTTADAMFALDAATTFAEFREAARLFAVPRRTSCMPTPPATSGTRAPGSSRSGPLRRRGAPAGYWPAPGWDSQYDWRGWVPFEDLPTSYDPPEGYLVAANQAVTASSRPFLTSEWDYGYRAQRIRDLLTAAPEGDPATDGLDPARHPQRFRGDHDGGAARGGPLRRRLHPSCPGPAQGWDYAQPADTSRSSAAAACFNAVGPRPHHDLLRRGEPPARRRRPLDGRSDRPAQDPSNPWWDDKSTPGVVENEQGILRTALVDARLDLTKTLGKDPRPGAGGGCTPDPEEPGPRR